MKKKILYTLNVFNRSVDLKIHLTLLRKEFGNEVIFATLCNGDIKPSGLEDTFIKYPNRGHHEGTLDSIKLMTDLSNKFEADIAVWAHAKSWWTDFKVIRNILENMEYNNYHLSMIDPLPLGALNDKVNRGWWCDWMAFDTELLYEAGPMIEHNDVGDWTETQVERHYKNLVKKDNILIIPAITPIAQNGHRRTDIPPYDKIFKNIMNDENCHILAHYDIKTKLALLKQYNIEAFEEVKGFISWDN